MDIDKLPWEQTLKYVREEQTAFEGKEKTEDEWYVQYLIDRARAILGMKKIEWELLDK
jgi:hypothetical protein